MMLYPPIETVQDLLKTYRTVPVFFSALTDFQTPVGIFAALKGNSKNCFLLESAEQPERRGRYSFIGINPTAEITVRGREAAVKEGGICQKEKIGDPAAFLTGILEPHHSPRFAGYPRFTGGFVGYFGYDMLRAREKKLGPPPPDDLGMPDCVLHRYDEIVALDHLSGKTYVIQHISADTDVESQYRKCEKHAEELTDQIRQGSPEARKPAKPAGRLKIRPNVSEKGYAQMVETVKKHIRAGDIFQAVPSRRFEVTDPPDAFSVYRVLRATNPSPYLYYFQAPDYQICGASPEMLIRVENGTVTSRPIAGTSSRGKSEAEDKKLEQELLSDEKERAEHTMLVDLGRNDVGRVCKFGTVKVRGFMHVERASKVMHLVSEVSGKLRKDETAAGALLAALPAGTLSGAPKIRAMQIIDDLEPVKRGMYGGAIGYLGYDGNIDTCIAIRTALFRHGKAYVQAGAGIVADSVPEKECRETENKARAVLDAIRKAAEL
jgi:anthranilate synthase component 1